MSVLQKATQTLDLLAEAHGPMRLGAVSAALGLPKSSTHRMLAELAAHGLVRRDDAGYALGPRLIYWGAVAGEGFDLRALADAPMHRLRDLTGESVHLYVVENGSRVCILSVESTYSLRPFVALGRPLPLGFGSGGKLLLAYSSESRQRAAIEDNRTNGRFVVSIEELEQIRQDGFATSYGEREDGVVGAAVPVRGPEGRVAAAITISGPSSRLSQERLDALRGPMLEVAAEIDRRLAATVARPRSREPVVSPAWRRQA